MIKSKVLPVIYLIMFISALSCKSESEGEPLDPKISTFTPATGDVGTSVVISGSDFTADASVSFNGIPAVVTSVTPLKIETSVPEGATTGPITIAQGGTTLTTSESFTVLPALADDPSFYFGADLSYVNQILDHGGVYKMNNAVKDPYEIFSENGTDLVRLRLWHNPVWTKEVYNPDGSQLYNDLLDVAHSVTASKQQGMKVLLDFHYSDFWADPGRQEIPAAWLDIKDINVLRDSVYNYTFKTLEYLDNRNLMPEFVQLGNEINCGMLYEYNENPVQGFPSCRVCDSPWTNIRTVMNAAIKAVRDVSASSSVKTKIILHVADPINIDWWFGNITQGVSDFDIIGFSYYPIWHTGVPVSELSDRVAEFKATFNKDIMILETAYPWTNAANDSYGNLFGSQAPMAGFPYTEQGQFDMMKAITQELVDGGGIGIVYWEPAWITSDLRDFWNTGSSWENCAFFDYNGNVIKGMDYMKHNYDR